MNAPVTSPALDDFVKNGNYKIEIAYEEREEAKTAPDMATSIVHWDYNPPVLSEDDDDVEEYDADDEDAVEDAEDEDDNENEEAQDSIALNNMGTLTLTACVSRAVLQDYHRLATSPFVSLNIKYYDAEGKDLQFVHRFEGFVDPQEQPASDNSITNTRDSLKMTFVLHVVADMWCLE